MTLAHFNRPLLIILLGSLFAFRFSSGLCAAESDIRHTLETTEQATETRLRNDLKQLSSDDWEGRGLDTAGINKAADMIAAEFKRLGYNTELFDGTPFQQFTVVTSNKLGDAKRNVLTINPPTGEPIKLKLGTDFTPLSLGGSAKLELPLVFAGYGISSKDDKYDDYANLDVKDKIVILLRHEPQQRKEDGPFDGKKDSQHAALMRKVSNAYQHGATAVIFVTDEVEIRDKIVAQRKQLLATVKKLQPEVEALEKAATTDLAALAAARKKLARVIDQLKTDSDQLGAEFDPLLPFERGDASESRKMPVLHFRRATLDPVIKAATGKTLSELETAIDSDLKPRSQELTGYKLVGEVHVERIEAQIKNVIGVLAGSGPLAEETIIIGAHYDHLGRGGAGSLQPGSQEIHNGADDNGSGTAALLEVARRIAALGKQPRRIVLIAFTGEERGLLGSGHYVHNPLFPLNKTVAMLNMDMVGRLKDEQLTIYGTGTAKEFDELLTKLNERDPYHFKIKREPSGFGPSDHASFYAGKIPVLHLFTGLHNDYHRPSDDLDKVNFSGIRRISELCTDLAIQIATTEAAPTFQETSGGRFGAGGEKKGTRPYFGSIPDLASTVEGYALNGVAKDGPADRGGLKGGDIIIGVAEHKIGTLDDFDNALRKFKAGDTVEVTVQRANDQLKLKVTLEAPK